MLCYTDEDMKKVYSNLASVLNYLKETYVSQMKDRDYLVASVDGWVLSIRGDGRITFSQNYVTEVLKEGEPVQLDTALKILRNWPMYKTELKENWERQLEEYRRVITDFVL